MPRYKDFFVTSFLKVATALGGLILSFVLLNKYGVEVVGQFSVILSLVYGLGIISSLGVENVLIREVSKSEGLINVKPLINSMCITMIISIILSLVLTLVVDFFFDEYSFFSLGFALCITPLSLLWIGSGYMKGSGDAKLSGVFDINLSSLITAAAVYFLPHEVENVGVFLGWVFLSSSIIVLLLGTVIIYYTSMNKVYHNSDYNMYDYFLGCGTFCITSLTSYLQGNAITLLSAMTLNNHQIGLLRFCTQLSMLVSFPQIIFNIILPANFSKFFNLGYINKLESLARKTATVSAVISIVIIFTILLGMYLFPSLMGNPESEFILYFVTLSIAQLINVSTGSVGYILNMTMNHKVVRNVSVIIGCVGLLMIITSPWSDHVWSYIFVLSFMTVSQNIILCYLLDKIVGIKSFVKVL